MIRRVFDLYFIVDKRFDGSFIFLHIFYNQTQPQDDDNCKFIVNLYIIHKKMFFLVEVDLLKIFSSIVATPF
jgi:hypothetical protein